MDARFSRVSLSKARNPISYSRTLQSPGIPLLALRSGHHLVIRRVARSDGARRASLLDAVAEAFGPRVEVAGASAGHHAVLWLRDAPPEAAAPIRARAFSLGVGIYPIAPFYARSPPCTGFLLGYAGLEPTQIQEGVARLSQAVSG